MLCTAQSALQTIGSVSKPKLFPLSQVLVSVDPVAGLVPVLHANVTVVPWSTDVAVEPGTLMPLNPLNEHPCLQSIGLVVIEGENSAFSQVLVMTAPLCGVYPVKH